MQCDHRLTPVRGMLNHISHTSNSAHGCKDDFDQEILHEHPERAVSGELIKLFCADTRFNQERENQWNALRKLDAVGKPCLLAESEEAFNKWQKTESVSGEHED